MSIQWTRSGSPVAKLTILDNPKLTLPNSDWAIGVVVIFKETTTSAATQAFQCVFRTATNTNYDTSIVCNWVPTDSTSTNAGKFYFFANGDTGKCHTPPVELGKAYVLVIQRVGGGLVSKLCPILNSAPADGSAVMSSVTFTFPSKEMDGTGGLVLGEAVVANRRFEHSMERFFRVDRALTDLEIAQLAYGKEITQIASPVWYIPMKDVTDYKDVGSQANDVLIQGGLTTGRNVGYAYNSLPVAPSFSGKPAISGSAVVNQPLSFTPATVMGNPFPTLKIQWVVNNVPIAGANGPNYTPTASQVGLQICVKQIATNTEGSVEVTSDSVLISDLAAGLTLDEPVAERIYQHTNGFATIPFSGSFSDVTPEILEYQLYAPDRTTVVKEWTPFEFTIVDDISWEASIDIPVPSNSKKYLMAIREKKETGQVLVTTNVSQNRFGVGDIYLVTGSSSPMTWFGDGSGTNVVLDPTVCSTVWTDNGSPVTWDNLSSRGRAGAMATYMAEQLKIPVAFINLAAGGTTLREWQDKTSAMYSRVIKMVTFVGGKIGGVFLSAGSNDVTGAGAALTVAAHLEKLRQFAANVRETSENPSLPVLISGINRRGDALDLQAMNARTAERDFGDDPNVYHCQMMDIEVEGSSDPNVPGGVHPTGAGYRVQCERVQRVWSAARGKDKTYLRGPKITKIEYSGSNIVVSIVHRNGTDIADTPMKGFTVTDSQGVVGIVSTTRKNANQILIQCTRNLVNPIVKYLTGAWPLSNVEASQAVFDTGNYALPMTVESFMPAVEGTLSVYTPINRMFDFSYQIESAIVSVPKQYSVFRTLGFNYAIEGQVDIATGSFTTYQLTSSGTLRKNQPYKATLFKLGVVGESVGTPYLLSGYTNNDGRAIFDEVPFGDFFALISFDDGGICYQKGTVK